MDQDKGVQGSIEETASHSPSVGPLRPLIAHEDGWRHLSVCHQAVPKWTLTGANSTSHMHCELTLASLQLCSY